MADGSLGAISNNNVYALLKDHQNRLWVGTWQGLNRYDETTKTFEKYLFDAKGEQLSSNQITYLFEDSQNRIWIGTFEGVNIFYPEKNIFESYLHVPNDKSSLSHNFINCIMEDSQNNIWIGTNNGLNRFNETERNFHRLTTDDGLKNNVIYGILEDDSQRLWISTNKGIETYNRKDKKFENHFYNDGLQNIQFNTYSFYRLNDGTFLFGGTRGLTVFDPQKIINYPYNNHVLLTGLNINNERIQTKDSDEILNKHINQTKEIVLKHNQNTVTLNYTAINYINNSDISYLTKLENYDDDWMESGRSITYLKLPPGEYVFKVKTIQEGEAGEQVTSLRIRILKPWHLTHTAIFIYVLLTFSVIYIILWFSKERIKTLHQLRGERLEKKQISEINQMKLQFFTNISHEFRTPLTLILSPLEKILENPLPNEWLKQQLLLINKNAGRLQNLIDQLLDFRKSETGKLKLNVCQGDLIHFLNEIFCSFIDFADKNEIQTNFSSQLPKLEILFDKNIIERIVFNLMSNAFKFTPGGGKVDVLVKTEDQWAVIEVADTGIGISQKEISLIFERYYSASAQTDQAGTGIGLALTKHLIELHHGDIKVESTVNKGTKLIVRLPLSNESYSNDELSFGSIITGGQKKYLELINEEEPETLEIKTDTKVEKDTILIVEDHIEILNYLKDNFSADYNIRTATNGKEALKMAEEDYPALIISDIMMPVMNGIQLCKKLKQNIKTSHIPLVLLTAKTTAEDQVIGFDSGADDYISKPFSINVLEAKVSNLIRSRRRLRDYYSQTLEVDPEEIAFNPLDKEILKKSKEIIHNYLSDPEFSVEIFAREIGMSRSNLHLKLKAITGESTSDFIRKIRLAKAVELLEERKYSVSEISYMVGYSSASYFTTTFKKFFGYRPSEHFEQKKITSSS
jgi:signal transduction histidine kinase/DNA-binding response OmpR family regulator